MLNQKKLNTKILENQVQVATFSKVATLPANGQGSVLIDIDIPSGATIKAVSLGTTPNGNWVYSSIGAYNATTVTILYHNTSSSSMSGTYEVAVFYTI